MEITPKFDFTQDTPQAGRGQNHKDGVLGIYPKGSPSEKNEQLAAKLFNEYERVMNALAEGLGDPDFSGTWQGADISSAGNAIRRLKQDLNLLAQRVDDINNGGEGPGSVGNPEQLGIGIERDFLEDGDDTVNEQIVIQSNLYTPLVPHVKYQPSYEVVSVENRTVTVLGGKITTPSGKVPTIRNNNATHFGYEFPIDPLIFLPNQNFQFGVGTSLPANEYNKIQVVGGNFGVPYGFQEILFKGRQAGSGTYGLGAGSKTFTYSDLTGGNQKEVTFVLVAGTVVDGFIDTTQVFSVYLGHSYLSYQNFTQYKALIDPRQNTGLVDTGNVTDGAYYIYFYEGQTQYSVIGVKNSTGTLEMKELLLTSKGIPIIESGFTPLYFIVRNFDPQLYSNTAIPEECSFKVHSRTSHSAESSIDRYPIADSLIDVREFRKRKLPSLAPAASRQIFDTVRNPITYTDFNGIKSKVVPAFVGDIFISAGGGIETPVLAPNGEYVKATISFGAYEGKGSIAPFFGGAGPTQNLLRIANGKDGLDLRLVHVGCGTNVQRWNGVSWISYDDSGDSVSQNDTIFEFVLLQNKTILAKAEFARKDISYSWNWTWDEEYGTNIQISDPFRLEAWLRVKTNANATLYRYFVRGVGLMYSSLYTKLHTSIAGQTLNYLADWHATNPEYAIDAARFYVDSSDANKVKIHVRRNIRGGEPLEFKDTTPLKRSPMENEPYQYSQKTDISTSLTANTIPEFRTSVNSLINQYFLVLDSNHEDVYLYAVHKQDPRRNREVKINLTLNPGDYIPTNKVVNGIESPIMILQCEMPDRPKAIIPVINGTTLSLNVVSFPWGVFGDQIVDVVKEIDITGLKFLGIFRNYDIDWERKIPVDVDLLDGLQLFFYNTANNTIRIHNFCLRRRTPTGYIFAAGRYINFGPPYGIETWAPGRDFYIDFNILKDKTVPSDIAITFVLTDRNSDLYGRGETSHTGAFCAFIASENELMTVTYRNDESDVYLIGSTAQDANAVQTTNVQTRSFSTTGIVGFAQKDGMLYIDATTPSAPVVRTYNPFTDTIT